MTGKFESKVVVVTGGTSGIGLATAKRFATEGASVFVTGRRQEELDAAVRTIGGRVSERKADFRGRSSFLPAIRSQAALAGWLRRAVH
jgi:NADP-dependent 3-hydroxy acid dehydrogenase YdfG